MEGHRVGSRGTPFWDCCTCDLSICYAKHLLYDSLNVCVCMCVYTCRALLIEIFLCALVLDHEVFFALFLSDTGSPATSLA